MKYLALDIGNVLVNVDFTGVLNLISKTANISINDAEQFLIKTQKFNEIGLTTLSQELEKYFNIKSPILINNILHEWYKCGKANDLILDEILQWKKEMNLNIALLSNIGIEHAYIMPKLLSYGYFYDYTIKHISCEVGARKPSLIYYQSFLQQFPEFSGCVYVDDISENLEASKKFGFKTFQFSLKDLNSPKEINKKLKELKKLLEE